MGNVPNFYTQNLILIFTLLPSPLSLLSVAGIQPFYMMPIAHVSQVPFHYLLTMLSWV